MISNSTSIDELIKLLEETNDPSVAFFTYASDDKGERGIIHANKEGLRLYALDLLKKSRQMEDLQDGKNICFKQQEWMVSETGYNLISAVKPAYRKRDAILKEQTNTRQAVQDKIASQGGSKGCMGMVLVLLLSLCTIGAAIKCFY